MQVRVRLPTHLDLYTEGEREFALVLDDDARLDDVLLAAEARFPGVRFRVVNEQDRIRRHIKNFRWSEAGDGACRAFAGRR